MAFEILLFLVGIIFLVKFSDITIKNAVRLSKKSGISEMTIGFVLIAVATSLPELGIAVMSSVKHEGLLSFGNLVGANVTNLTLIFGLLALFSLKLDYKDVEKSINTIIIVTIIGMLLLIVRGIDLAFGIFLLIVFYAFARGVMSEGIKINDAKYKGRAKGVLSKELLYLLGSVAAVVVSAYVVTESAISISRQFGIAETLIGVTVLAIGTTLPELSVGIAAVRKRNVELALGNALGSVVTNLTLILGIAAIINPLSIPDLGAVALVSMVLVNLVFLYFVTRRVFRAIEGILLWALYVFFIMVMVMVGAL